MDNLFSIEIIAKPGSQSHRLTIQVAPNTSIRAVMEQEAVKAFFYPLTLSEVKLGCFGEARSFEHILQPKERIEILAPLIIDPKEARRIRALQSNYLPRAVRGRLRNK